MDVRPLSLKGGVDKLYIILVRSQGCPSINACLVSTSMSVMGGAWHCVHGVLWLYLREPRRPCVDG